MFDIAMIGHLTKDIISVNNTKTEIPGGAVYFSSIAAAVSGADVLVNTRIAEKESSYLSEMTDAGVTVNNLGSKKTVCMNLNYSDDMETREISVSDLADPFLMEDVTNIDASIFHLAGLIRGDFRDEMISYLSKKGEVALDVQSVLRCEKDSKLFFEDWADKKKYLPFITYLKTDAAEAEILTGESDRYKAAKFLYSWGVREVIITHMSELLVYNGTFNKSPFTMRNMTGRSGRGDTCFASYLAWRKNHSVNDSTKYAAALTSIKMESPGAFKGTIQDVKNRMEK
ncbi:MAG: carbohydrate kinase [Spirochaetales bacterium]|nr:carbohydrate kinase [Spirochaetales bacterium]